ncbi:hypothetical protein YC2023_037469 [Brassica napus]
MGFEEGCKSTPNSKPSKFYETMNCHRHRHTSDSDQISYFGMVAQTICEDSVLNHRSKLPWMKRQSTNCQRRRHGVEAQEAGAEMKSLLPRSYPCQEVLHHHVKKCLESRLN